MFSEDFNELISEADAVDKTEKDMSPEAVRKRALDAWLKRGKGIRAALNKDYEKHGASDLKK